MQRTDLLFRIEKETLQPVVLLPGDWYSTLEPTELCPMWQNALSATVGADDLWIKSKTRPPRTRAEWGRCQEVAQHAGLMSNPHIKVSGRFYMREARASRLRAYYQDRPEKQPVFHVRPQV